MKLCFEQSNLSYRPVLEAEPILQSFAPTGYRLSQYYTYLDICNKPSLIVARYENKNEKTFRQFSYDENGWEAGGNREILPYRFDEGFYGDEIDIYIFEGEKCVDTAIEALKIRAVCIPGGANGWDDEYAEWFKGNRVYIVPDNDKPGLNFAKEVYKTLCTIAEVHVLFLPDLCEKEDIVDWLNKGHTAEEFFNLVACSSLASFMPKLIPGLPRFWHEYDLDGDEINWLVEGLIPQGGVCLTIAKPKVGKSVMMRFLASKITKGDYFLGRECSQGPVVIIDYENQTGDIVAHFTSMGNTKAEKILLAKNPNEEDPLGYLQTVVRLFNPKIIMIDPLQRFVRFSDSNNYEKTYDELYPFKEFAEKNNTTILFTHHSRKGNDSSPDSFLGSTALYAFVDTMIGLDRTKNFTKIWTKQRYGAEIDGEYLLFDPVKRSYEVAPAKPVLADDDLFNKILACLKTEQSKRPDEISNETDIQPKLLNRLLALLIKRNLVVEQGKGVKGNPKVYLLKKDSSEN